MAQRVICTKEAFLKIINHFSERPYITAYSLIEKLSNLYLPIDKEEYLSLLNDNPVIKQLAKRANLSVVFKTDISKIINTPLADDIFILNNCPNSETMRLEKGILVVDTEELEFLEVLSFKHFSTFNFLKKDQKDNLIQKNIKFANINSWSDALKNCVLTPINSAIIIDNYLFHDLEKGRQSLISLLQAIVPYRLKGHFHLTIFVENSKNNLKKESIKNLIDEIHGLKLGPKILVKIVAHVDRNATHDRALLTNYHYVSSGKGFGVIVKNKIIDNTKGEAMSTLHNICYLSDLSSVKTLHGHLIYWMKRIHRKGGTESVNSFHLGDEFTNRLLMEE